MENLIIIDNLEVPLFQETSIYEGIYVKYNVIYNIHIIVTHKLISEPSQLQTYPLEISHLVCHANLLIRNPLCSNL